MDSHARELSFLAQSVRRSTSALRSEIHAVKAAVGDSALCAYLLDILTALEDQVSLLEQRSSQEHDEVARTAIVQQLRLLNLTGRGLHEATPWLKSLRKPELDLGVSYFLTEAGNALLHGPAELILNADVEYMYSTLALESSFTRLLTELGHASPEVDPPVIINYPALERDTLLLHSVLVHELGHEAIDRHSLRDVVFQRYDELNALDARFASAVSAFVESERSQGREWSLEEAGVILRRCLSDWLEEVICDYLALAYLGPSYLFAATAFLLAVTSTQGSQTHPATAVRLRLLLRLTERLGWMDVLERQAGAPLAWLREVAEQPSPGRSPHEAFLEEALVDLETTTQDVVMEHLSETLLTPEWFERNADELLALVGMKILPAQLDDGSAPDRRAILLAVWLDGLLAYASPGDLVSLLSDRNRQSMLGRALEMSVVLERWRS